jgi:hypothetical protein
MKNYVENSFATPSLTLPEGVKKLNFSPAHSGVKTGVQSVRKAPKMLDSGLRRNDVQGNQIDFFTPSPLEGEGVGGGASSWLQGVPRAWGIS